MKPIPGSGKVVVKIRQVEKPQTELFPEEAVDTVLHRAKPKKPKKSPASK